MPADAISRRSRAANRFAGEVKDDRGEAPEEDGLQLENGLVHFLERLLQLRAFGTVRGHLVQNFLQQCLGAPAFVEVCRKLNAEQPFALGRVRGKLTKLAVRQCQCHRVRR